MNGHWIALDEDQFKQIHALWKKYPNLTYSEIGRLVVNGVGGVSSTTVSYVLRASTLDEYKVSSKERNDRLHANRKKHREETVEQETLLNAEMFVESEPECRHIEELNNLYKSLTEAVTGLKKAVSELVTLLKD